MILFVSDLHLGRGTPEASREADRDAVAMLRAHEADVLDGGTLVLLGDVFDQFIEYRHLVPKAGPRLVGLLADWADRGADILYAVGNRDPWHVDFFEGEIGVRVQRTGARVERGGWGVYLAHGDGHASGRSFFQPLLRAPLMARLYRMGLPGDAGFALARWTARRFGTDGVPDSTDAEDLARAADTILRRPDVDLVAFGHVHETALETLPGGTYLNPGYWYGDRTFARLDRRRPGENGPPVPGLFRWADGRALPVAPATPRLAPAASF